MVAVIPMAGRGSRYTAEGFNTPKPFIEIGGKPMIYWALKSLENIEVSRFVFVILREHEERLHVSSSLNRFLKGAISFVFLDNVTEGQLCTVLAAKEYFSGNDDVLVAASDTWVQSSIGQHIKESTYDGLISVASLPGEQWSFARTDSSGRVVEVAEKRRISNLASTGLYYFKNADNLITFGEEMIALKETTRGEFYVIPVYQKMIDAGFSIGVSKAQAMRDMGTPDAKASFELFLSKSNE